MEYTIEKTELGDARIEWGGEDRRYMILCDWDVREKYLKLYGLTKEVTKDEQ